MNRTPLPIVRAAAAERVKLLDRLAERWLCCRYGWNVGIFRGARVRGLQYRPYRVLHSRQLMFRINPKFDLLRVDEWERFGNSVMQLRNVIYVAEHLGVGAIAFPEKHPFFSGEHAVTAKCNSHTLAFAFCKGSDVLQTPGVRSGSEAGKEVQRGLERNKAANHMGTK